MLTYELRLRIVDVGPAWVTIEGYTSFAIVNSKFAILTAITKALNYIVTQVCWVEQPSL